MALLEGLEAVEISYKKSILIDNETLRYDSEYFFKSLLFNVDKLKKLPHEKLSNIADVKGGKRLPLGDDFMETGIPYIRAEDIKNSFVQYKRAPFISEKTHAEIAAYQTFKNDVLLTIVGNSIGDIGLVKFELDKCNLTENCVKVTSKNKKLFNNDYLFLFFISHYGQIQITREKVGTAQPKLAIERIRRFLIPMLNIEFQEKLSDILIIANDLLLQKESTYTQAETLLLETLGMADFTPSSEAVNIKSFKESFAVSGRLDPEYYQPKYDYLENVFNQFDRVRLADLVNHPICSGTTPKANGDDYSDAEHGVPFVRAVDLQGGLVSLDNLNYIKPQVHHGVLKRTQLMKNDFLFSIAGTVGRCSVFEHNIEANINQAVAILRFDDELINRYCLMVFFNSPIGKELVEKHARQGVQTNLNLTELGDLSIPILDMPMQRQIADLVQQSFALKAKSTHLLDVAKRAVEIAIEQDEAAAFAYIAENAGR